MASSRGKEIPDELLAKIKKQKQEIAGVSWLNVEGNKYGLIAHQGNKYIFSLQDKDLLGQGSRATVYKAWKLQERGDPLPLALKVIPLPFDSKKDQDLIDEVKNEYRVAADVSPGTTLPPLKVGRQLYVITERIEGVTLVNDRGKLNEEVAALNIVEKLDLIIEILKKLDELHSKGWIHGDLKGQNILVARNAKTKEFKVSIIDLASARALQKEVKSNKSEEKFSPGSPGRLSPETIKGKFYPQTDVYALVPDILMILGVENPLKLKLAARKEVLNVRVLPAQRAHAAEASESYDIAGVESLLDNFDPPLLKIIGDQFLRHILNFMKSMYSSNYEERPTPLAAAAFFEVIKNAFQEYNQTVQKPSFWGRHAQSERSIMKILEQGSAPASKAKPSL